MQNIKKDYLWNSLGSLLQSAISPVLLIVSGVLGGFFMGWSDLSSV